MGARFIPHYLKINHKLVQDFSFFQVVMSVKFETCRSSAQQFGSIQVVRFQHSAEEAGDQAEVQGSPSIPHLGGAGRWQQTLQPSPLGQRF